MQFQKVHLGGSVEHGLERDEVGRAPRAMLANTVASSHKKLLKFKMK